MRLPAIHGVLPRDKPTIKALTLWPLTLTKRWSNHCTDIKPERLVMVIFVYQSVYVSVTVVITVRYGS